MIRILMCLCVLFCFSLAQAQDCGEAVGPKSCFPSNTKGYDGDPALNGLIHHQTTGPNTMAFGGDVQVRNTNLSSIEKNQVMASDSKGNLYVAWEDSLFPSNSYIQIYKSQDGGETWTPYSYVLETSVDLREPSIAIGEGAEDILFIAYIRDDGVNMPVPEVASKPLDQSGWTFTYVPVWNFWEGYAKPVINTDSNKHHAWYAYLTCEGIVNSSKANINVCTWRSKDRGDTWGDEWVLFGNNDAYAWKDPDASYGTKQKDLFVVCFNDHDDSVYLAHSDNSGSTWAPIKSVFTLTSMPSYPVDPEIAAAVNHNNLMIACTVSHKGNDNIGYAFSNSLGAVWTPLMNLKGLTKEFECAVSLSANEAGNSWHLAWTAANYICYAHCPQDLSSGWSSPVTVNDLKFGSFVHNKKGIASVWNTDAPCVCWSDFRDGGQDIDTYADFPENLGLASDAFMVDCSEGGSVNLTLNAGVGNMNRYSLIFGSVSGVSPGSVFPGGALLPLNWDLFTNMVINLTNTPIFQNFYGKHDSMGKRTATLNVSPFANGPYVLVYFAYVMMNPWNQPSNPISIMIKP